MKPLENYKVNKITISSKRNTNSNEQSTNPLNNINRPLQYTSKINSSNSQSKNINLNINPNNQKNNNIQNKNLLSPINTTPSAQESNKLNINPQTSMSEREKEEYERTQKYINYLKEHLNSSYYANNEINNKNHILNEKTIILNEEIKNNNILYDKNKKLQKDLLKANEELDQYEIESKEADIEIKSFKMKIIELFGEIKKLKHKETIQEVIEENYDDEDDINNNIVNIGNIGNIVNYGYNNKIKMEEKKYFCNKLLLYIKRFLIRYKYKLFVKFQIKKEVEILNKMYEKQLKYQNNQNK